MATKKKTTKAAAKTKNLEGRDELTPRALQIVVRSSHLGKDGKVKGSRLRGGNEVKAAALAQRHGFIDFNERTDFVRPTPKGVELARQLEAER